MITLNKNILPDFLIVGAQKSATTTLYKILNSHNDIYMPDIKEVNFFAYNKDDIELNEYKKYDFGSHFKIITNLEEYYSLFANANSSQIIGESSVNYLFRYKQTIKKIKEIYKNDYKKVKIIISLRNPIDRAFSSWVMNVRDNRDNRTFENAISFDNEKKSFNSLDIFKYLEYGLYYYAVKEYLDTFDRVYILLYDNLIDDFNEEIKKIFKFLSIKVPSKSVDNKNYNVSGIPKIKIIHEFAKRDLIIKKIVKYFLSDNLINSIRNIINKNYVKPRINQKTRNILTDYYNDDLKRLNKIINVENWIK